MDEDFHGWSWMAARSDILDIEIQIELQNRCERAVGLKQVTIRVFVKNRVKC